VNSDLSAWTPRERPGRAPIQGGLVRLEPLDPARHGDGLYAVSTVPDAMDRFRYLGNDYPPKSREDYRPWLDRAAAGEDPRHYTVLDRRTGAVLGRQALMRIDHVNGVIEIGNIYWGPDIARTPKATEALYLFARYAFDALGYRRFEWKCDNDNEPSKSAALRFGFAFEGIFRQHMVMKGKNRDTAWFAMLDHEWPVIREAFERWLDPENFDATGQQIKRLVDIRAALA
jgi:RimJ/RimL family protein N-acetyltransferase